MIKKTLNIVLALTLVIAGITVVNIDTAAATPDMSYKWGVTYDGSKFSSTFNASDAILKDVMPGDTIEYVVTYENLHNKNKDSDFYLSTSVIKSLEDTSSASGGAYTFKITNIDAANKQTVLFDSETGGDAKNDSGASGLNLVNGNQGTYFSLGTVPVNATGKVAITIKLDGNSQTNAYMDALANLKLVFVAEPIDARNERKIVIDEKVEYERDTKYETVSDTKSIVKKVVKTLDNGAEVVEIDDSDVPLAGGDRGSGSPQTGDSMIPMVICTAMFIIGMCLIIWYAAICVNSKKKEVS